MTISNVTTVVNAVARLSFTEQLEVLEAPSQLLRHNHSVAAYDVHAGTPQLTLLPATLRRARPTNDLRRLGAPGSEEELERDREAGYQAMASDEEREQEALAWSEGLIRDSANDPN